MSYPPLLEEISDLPPFHKYYLAGLIINDDTVYFNATLPVIQSGEGVDSTVATEAEPPTLPLQAPDRSSTSAERTWYCANFYGEDGFELHMVTDERVIEAAHSEGRDGVTMIYASEASYQYPVEYNSIPAGLKVGLNISY